MRLALGFVVSLMAACGGSVTKAADAGGGATGDAAATDSSEDAVTCPPGSTIPDADVYMCEAGPAGSVGCTGESPATQNTIYPAGCVLLLTHASGFCGGTCCGPQSCTCQQNPARDGGLEFICPD
jgi:hypothetical protein